MNELPCVIRTCERPMSNSMGTCVTHRFNPKEIAWLMLADETESKGNRVVALVRLRRQVTIEYMLTLMQDALARRDRSQVWMSLPPRVQESLPAYLEMRKAIAQDS